MKVLNAFSVNMLQNFPSTVTFTEITVEDARKKLDEGMYESCVGHADTAALFSYVLEREIKENRCTVSLALQEQALLGQYIGPRLPEGCKELPEGATIKWFRISVG